MKFWKQTIFLLWTLLLCFTAPICLAQVEQEKDKSIKPKVEMLSFKLKITDPDDHPLEGATVSPYGLRSKADPGSFWIWPEKLLGPIPKLISDDEGLVDIPFPKYMLDKLETGSVALSVEHPDYVTLRKDRNVEDNQAEIQLNRGFRIAATAIDPEGKAIKHDLYGLISGSNSRLEDWKLANNGILVSPVFPHQKSWLRLMKVTKGEPVLFSDLIEIDPQEKGRIFLRDVKLSIGTRVEGKLHDSVTRPILNGYVSASIVVLGSNDPRQRWESQWNWSDKTPIAEDGTFVFESLPRDSILQLIPICDDWVPSIPTKAHVLAFFPEEINQLGNWNSRSLPQLVQLNEPIVNANLRMKHATTVRVKVTDQDGRPIPNANVGTYPNQYWFRRGSIVLGTAYPSTDSLMASRDDDLKPSIDERFGRFNRYTSQTDEDGIATIKNIPAGLQSFQAWKDGYEMPLLPLRGTDREVHWLLIVGVANGFTIRMQLEGTQMLDDKAAQPKGDDNEEEKT